VLSFNLTIILCVPTNALLKLKNVFEKMTAPCEAISSPKLANLEAASDFLERKDEPWDTSSNHS
jgi:hypothetical protein